MALATILAGIGVALVGITLRPHHASPLTPAALWGAWELASVNVNGEPPATGTHLANAGAPGSVWQFEPDGTLKLPPAAAGSGILGARYTVSWNVDPNHFTLTMKIKRVKVRDTGDEDKVGWGTGEEAGRRPRRTDGTVQWQGVLKLADDQLIICLGEVGPRKTRVEIGPGKLVLVYKRVRS